MAVSLSPDGDAVAVWAAPDDAAALRGNRAASPAEPSFPTVRVDPAVEVRVAVQEPGGRVLAVTTIPELAPAHPRVGLLPGGDLVLVGSRCWWTKEGVVPNAGVYSPSGHLRTSAVLGDGVASIEVTRRGEIWVGYFDEGIYGNFGWNRPGPRPIGAPGLLRYSRFLDLVWRYPDQARHAIDDGPSLNLVDDVLWMTHDSEYPVVRIVDGALTVWDSPLASASAVLVDGDVVALVGRRTVAVGALRDGAFQPTSTCALELPPRPLERVARGPTLHMFDAQGEWLTTDVPALLAASSS